ncbi:P27 family phage terminase small subunit [Bradyrhizobium sp. UFLA05-112]
MKNTLNSGPSAEPPEAGRNWVRTFGKGNPLAKKPPILTVIDPASKPDPLAPPPGLGEAGEKLWVAIHADFAITDAGGLAMLHQICAAADRVAECTATIARDGPVIRTKAGLKDHPLLRHELAAQSFIVRSLHRLGLDIEPTRHEIGRPAGSYRGE